MERTSQVYIGVPNGVVLCIDSAESEQKFTARLYHAYRSDAVNVTSPEGILPEMEKLFESLRFPFRTTNYRSFRRERAEYSADPGARPGRESAEAASRRMLSDDDLLDLEGELATFIIRVQQRQNSDWQGRITWAERDKTLNFRTVTELLQLIENAAGYLLTK
jgi:hypothetical protein